MNLGGWCTTTLLGSEIVYREGEVVGPPRGTYLARPPAPLAAD
jgi:hypothetical protein